MGIELQKDLIKKVAVSKTTAALEADDKLRRFAFDNTAQANIITD